MWNLVPVCVGESVSAGAIQVQDKCTICTKRTIGSEIVLGIPIILLGEWVMWNLVSVHLEIVLVSVQYRGTVCTINTIGSEIILDAPDRTSR
jgi:hypothetical protein